MWPFRRKPAPPPPPHDGLAHAGEVSTEGGPFLVADARAIRSWRATKEAYGAVCGVFEANGYQGAVSWPVGGVDAIAWEPEGEGTTDVLVLPGARVVLVRGWFDGDWDAATREAAALPFTATTAVGHVDVPSCLLVVLWSPEDGACVRESDIARRRTRPTGPLAVDGSTLLVPVEHRRFRCAADRVSIPAGEAVRCLLEPA